MKEKSDTSGEFNNAWLWFMLEDNTSASEKS